MTWYERLARVVKTKKIKQSDLARSLGVAQGAVSNTLSGKRPHASAETILAYANALNVSLSWVMTGEGSDNPSQTLLQPALQNDLLQQFVGLAARVSDAERPFWQIGETRFRQYIQDREPEHTGLVDEFLAGQKAPWPQGTTSVDVEEELLLLFRKWRMVRAKK